MNGGRALIDRIADGAFALGLLGVAWLALFGHRGLAPAAGLMALAVALRAGVWRDGFALLRPSRLRSEPLSLAFAAFVLFCIWIAATAFWAPLAGAEWLGLTVLSSTLAAGALVYEALNATPGRIRRLSALFAVSVTTACAGLMFEGLSGAYLREIIPPDDLSPLRWRDFTSLGRGVTAMAPLVFPLATILRPLSGSWLAAFAPAIALYVAAANFSIFANVAALAGGGAAFAIAARWPRFGLKALAAIFIGAIVFAPALALLVPSDAALSGPVASMPISWAQRLIVWREAGVRALGECFPFGCGADYARALKERATTVVLPGWPAPLSVMPTHPHNVFLQVWLELGLPGVILFALSAGAGFAALLKARLRPDVAAAVCAAIAAAFLSLIFEASLWQVWRLAVLALGAFGCALAFRGRATPS